MLDLLYPHSCKMCGADLPKGIDILCDDCLKKGDYYFYDSFTADYVDDADSPLVYRDFVREAMHRYKFNGRRAYADWFARFTEDCIRSKMDIWKPDFITYVPLSFGRWFKRGYNQSELVAKLVANKIGLKCESTLKKRVFVKRQSEITDYRQRVKNVSNAFVIKSNVRLEKRRVLLIDDVVTTGATISACGSVLHKSGAEKVFVVSMTKTPVKHQKN